MDKMNCLAITYLNQWLLKDRHFYRNLRCLERETKLRCLKEAAAFYRIARNLPNREGVQYGDIERYSKLLRLLEEVDVSSVLIDPVSAVLNFSEQLSGAYWPNHNRHLISASSKFLWIKFRSPVLIYDSLSRKTLGTRAGDYRAFCEAWLASFDKLEGDISAACEALKQGLCFSADSSLALDDYDNLLAPSDGLPWFKHRIHDLFLLKELRKEV